MTTLPSATDAWHALRQINDPEFGINLVDLGLIYDVSRHEGRISVRMTLTTPTCPSGQWIYEGVKASLSQLPGVVLVDVALVFDPVWTPARLSASARQTLGI